MDELKKLYKELTDIFEQIKSIVKNKDPDLFKRWKAGGFMTTSEESCTYNLEEVIEKLSVKEHGEVCPICNQPIEPDEATLMEYGECVHLSCSITLADIMFNYTGRLSRN
jgi:uncharacterized protein with PIN domain